MDLSVRTAHGVVSLCLMAAALMLGLAGLFLANSAVVLLYAVLLVFMPLVVTYNYCAKCPCARDGCGHVVPGWIASRLFRRTPGPYTPLDYIGTFVPFAAIVAMPQAALWRHTGLFTAYWALMAAAMVEIAAFVCPSCGNVNCILCRGKGRNG